MNFQMVPVRADQHFCAVHNDEFLFHLSSELSARFGTVCFTLNTTNGHSLYEEKEINISTLAISIKNPCFSIHDIIIELKKYVPYIEITFNI